MVITKTHNVNANNALELWHEAPYSINHKAMKFIFKDLEDLAPEVLSDKSLAV